MNNDSYRAIPFCPETPYNDFYIYMDLKDIPEKCEDNQYKIIRCRTIGILQSENGRFYLSDFDSTGTDRKPLVQVSVVYMQSPPQSTVIPYPIQIFGSLQWKNRPVIYAKIIQVMKAQTAIILRDTLRGTMKHLAANTYQIEEGD